MNPAGKFSASAGKERFLPTWSILESHRVRKIKALRLQVPCCKDVWAGGVEGVGFDASEA